MRDRSWRRAQRERIIARTRRWMSDYGWFTDPYTRWEDSEKDIAVRKNAITPHPCSSYCCGNPRKWFGDDTLQEKRVKDWKDVLADEEECARKHQDDE